MRILMVFSLCLLPLAALAQGAPSGAKEILAESSRRAQELPFTSSYVATLVSEYEGEEVFSLTGSLIFWVEYPRVRVETTGLEDVFLPVQIADLAAGAVYSYAPERGWAKHVLSGGWLSLIDLDKDPLFRRVRFGEVEEGTLGGEAVWILRGEMSPDPLGLMRRFEMSLWMDKASYVVRKAEIYFEFYFPGLDFATTNSMTLELTGYREVPDIPDGRFAVPEEAPEAPDSAGRVFPRPAPDLRGAVTSGEEIALADMRGQAVIVFFWDMDAEIEGLGFNLALMEGLRALGEGKGLAVIGVAEGDPELIGAFLEGFGAGLPTVTDGAAWAEALGVTGPPACVLIDPRGNVYAVTDPLSILPLVIEVLEG